MNKKKTVSFPDQESTEKETPLIFYSTKEVALFLGCSIPTAREIMQRADFPLIRVGKNLRVYKQALEQWAMSRRA